MKIALTPNTFSPWLLTLAVALLATHASAQMPNLDPVTCDLRGELRSDGALPSGLVVELRSSQGSRSLAEAYVDPSGSFQLSDIGKGQYVLVVRTHSGTVLHQEFVDVNRNTGELWIQLPKAEIARPVSGTVSVARLAHKVPSKALKEFEKARKAADKGKSKDEILHLQRALEIDPDYMEAHNNLGSQYLRREEYGKAEAHFRKACELDPGASIPQTNLATVLLINKHSADAEIAARRAVSLDPSNSRARYTLALTLLDQGKNPQEALEQLQRAASDLPRAHLVSAKVLQATGDVNRARVELKTYLPKAKPEEKQDLQTWLTKLDNPTQQ